MPRDILSEQQMNIKFVKAVQRHPTLYNFELPSYSRKDVSDKAWEDVGRTMNMTPPACRERWRNLRAVFMRTMRAPPRGSTGVKKPYYLADVMQFVVPYMRTLGETAAKKQQAKEAQEAQEKRPVQVAIEEIKVEQLDDDDSSDWAEDEREMSVSRKRSVQDDEPQQSVKVARIAQPSSSTVTLDSDHIKSFLNSLLPELNEMNSVQFKNFKRRVLLLIDDITTEIPASPRRRTNESEYIM
uniref:MADF domain-containing protein n=1 Tax=Heliothis virescens TaxID=7102 RepID=A0A2A4J6Q7_HELVI